MKLQYRKNIITPFQAEDYILQDDLKNAVEVAIALGQPLLITGAPGTGKTRLAWKVAHLLSQEKNMNYDPEPLVFYTKTTSTAQDLFYSYDAVSHFQSANIKRGEDQQAPTTADFIELQALGKAIAQTNPGAIDTSMFATRLPQEARDSVVLIDEIDKAPRDFTNDILNEIERLHFVIKEQGALIPRSPERDIVVIMTSNSEKNLPDAFLRRCVFYHIPFPDQATLKKIVKSQLRLDDRFAKEALPELLKVFHQIRDESIRKAPATAELIAWLRILEVKGYLEESAENRKDLILDNLSILVKTKEDLKAIRDFLATY
jgi:MoxR-like ATPase